MRKNLLTLFSIASILSSKAFADSQFSARGTDSLGRGLTLEVDRWMASSFDATEPGAKVAADDAISHTLRHTLATLNFTNSQEVPSSYTKNFSLGSAIILDPRDSSSQAARISLAVVLSCQANANISEYIEWFENNNQLKNLKSAVVNAVYNAINSIEKDNAIFGEVFFGVVISLGILLCFACCIYECKKKCREPAEDSSRLIPRTAAAQCNLYK